ncbi:MAG: hypothetical protein A2913_01495 [Parcubacteria group bacterium RIFCSPLOWO2_01_FULL_40_65]|nr:MAG: hypothetical protein A2734_01040 [Parcubacteria group bacterium RIFCSPHIGHO2_01_FULL_40_30]OHB19224.1 MAG: hypothetical protein A3D40_00100 [Parcubacteria group bacterium RIFCSPHIGHO2_02_FULL_40_12]OHB22147.1 MAG: hypothetical protein A2913_01495 [Parcubacteria group bacterium RIFCSPLOWO2_01_FULL_40_65]OHB23301.1 MAG: hypothetical protein A3I22_02905 [Parcubacteria group bacterium RIFCSPLOWO2_02_FULL_40_12]OHB24126.1 MAG: hypothetical protein A3F96_01555 [Parcubacteria group bacterium R
MGGDYIIFPSAKSLFAIGIISAILSPLIGVILGFYFLRRPQLAKEGKIILLVAFIWLSAIFIFAF